MSESASISTGIAGRYATAVFDLALEQGALKALEADIDALDQAIADSDALGAALTSPLHGREEMEAAIGAVAVQIGVSETTVNTLRLMARNRRLFVLPHMLRDLRRRLAEHRGEVAADVTSAKPLTKGQTDKLSKALAAKTGREVTLNATVDKALIGGLVVKLGSTMIDTSIRAKLDALQNTMKEAR